MAILAAQELAKKTSVMQPLKEDRFLCGFSHIFAGGYSAGVSLLCWFSSCPSLIFTPLPRLRHRWIHVGHCLRSYLPPTHLITLLIICRATLRRLLLVQVGGGAVS